MATSAAPAVSGPTSIVLGRAPGRGAWRALLLDADGEVFATEEIGDDGLVAWVGAHERRCAPRWVVRSVRDVYPRLLSGGVRLRRAQDLLLCHAILRDTTMLPRPVAASPAWRRGDPTAPEGRPALFSLGDDGAGAEEEAESVLAELRRQRAALGTAPDARLELLCLAESAGALVAEEMTAAGLPWDEVVHDRILTEALGRRPPRGSRPERMAVLVREIGQLLEDPQLNPDSPPRLLRALRRAGVMVDSTSRWELAEVDHPVIPPLLAYKRMARLFTANGWSWLAEWVHEGRFRPVYITGGVVTGRWASAGGGALQIPRSLRPAVRADPGWLLVCADVAQLEPRVLAALSRDRAMADAAQGADLYAGIVRSGVVATREEAKYAVLGAMYGATTGDSGRLAPRLRSVFPRAMALVDAAAREGEEGGVVSTLLGRGSPRPDASWSTTQSRASDPDAGAADERRARSRARDRGRFTRNFVVQGTAAEWSLLWLAEIRHRLASLPPGERPAPRSGPVFSRQAHLAFFLHDEVIVHCPEEQAETVADVVRASADAATRRLFPGFPVEIPLDLRVSEDAGKGSAPVAPVD